jgi:hypothetical protein
VLRGAPFFSSLEKKICWYAFLCQGSSLVGATWIEVGIICDDGFAPGWYVTVIMWAMAAVSQ